MPSPYVRGVRWSPYVHGGSTYPFDHLCDFLLEVVDSAKVRRRLVVTFSDHVFTRDARGGDDPLRSFPGSTRRPPGHFCEIRYGCSLRLREIIEHCAQGDVWHLGGGDESYAQIPTIDQAGNAILYAVIFALDPVRELPFDLLMRVRSAYPCDESVPATFGSIRFRHLVALRAQSKRPKKVFGDKRQVPRLGRPIPIVSTNAKKRARPVAVEN